MSYTIDYNADIAGHPLAISSVTLHPYTVGFSANKSHTCPRLNKPIKLTFTISTVSGRFSYWQVPELKACMVRIDGSTNLHTANQIHQTSEYLSEIVRIRLRHFERFANALHVLWAWLIWQKRSLNSSDPETKMHERNVVRYGYNHIYANRVGQFRPLCETITF